MNAPVCKKCLLSERDAGELERRIEEYVSLIPEDMRTPPEEYRRRLEICRACGSFSGGLCGECGCFCKARAAKAVMDCPTGKWRRGEIS